MSNLSSCITQDGISTGIFSQIKKQALATDQATAGLIKDLKQRGLLEDTLVIWVNLEERHREAYSRKL